MLSYTSRRNMFGNLCNNSSAATLSLADSLMNDSEKRIIASKDWPWLWRQYTLTTVASQSGYYLPAYSHKPQSIYVTVGSYRYTPREVTIREDWDKINEVTIKSDIVTHYFVYDGKIELFPVPSTSGNTITVNARRVAKDLMRPDYTTGTITTTANAGVVTTVTGSGTTWTTAMIGRFIRITEDDTALTGDGIWYEIATVPSSTTLTLVRTYQGTALAAASASYTIGELSLIPEPHEQLPIFEALNLYFTSTDPDVGKAQLYGEKFKEGYMQMFTDYGSKTNVVLDDGGDRQPINPNLLISY